MKRLLFFLALVPVVMMAEEEWSEKSARKWVRQADNWQNGFSAIPDKSTDYVRFADQYRRNPEAWKAVFEWMASTDLATVPTGKYYVGQDSVLIIVQEEKTRPAAQSRIESHRKFIDFQYVVSGVEKYTLQHSDDTYITVRYNPKKDVIYYELKDDGKSKSLVSRPGVFFVFFPTDFHQAMISPDGTNSMVRKIVAKIPYK